MNLKNRVFNGSEYTLVDLYIWNNKEIISHFAGDENDLFCKNNENQYIPIEDEKLIDDILELYCLKTPDFFYYGFRDILAGQGISGLKKVSSEVRQELIVEQIDKLQELNNGLEPHILQNKLEKVKYYMADK